ncbi:sigma-54-dependent Fis family transcriptional regulator [Radiobacillus kanasensis]|uniref:sigma-54 interaction domain-containing protein n=1 Tax=Radiobacillus kanasensis TaxID=2844358 RepID=UPI001E379A7D|nr:sigma-54-dependent Fis family transcriptional regulator [Radiobacillus kanasensis]UFT97715.1 sigma-54-dependent Fis family transcriptional regulator [Radiobacillus kanasensis]
MKRVLIIGAGKGGTALLELLLETEKMEVVAIADVNKDAPGLHLARIHGIRTDSDWTSWLEQDIDIIIEATGDEYILQQILAKRHRNTVVIPGTVANIISELLNEKETLVHQLQNQTSIQELIMNNLHEGMIVIDDDETVTFVNKRAQQIVGVPIGEFVHRPIRKVIDTTRLPQVLRLRKKEVNQHLVLENGKKIITTRIPIIDSDDHLRGAFAIFRDITEVVELAEQVTGLREVQKMLEAIFHSSDEAISVVDDRGIGIMINPAYTKITGLKEEDIVGKPASVDISEGESMHMKVLKTRRAVRGARMKVGPNKKEVLVNVAPIIVDGKLKGSVGVLHDVSEIKTLTNELKRARQIIRNLEAKYTFDDIIGSSNEMTLAIEQAKVGARTPATVLLRGESGTGKELFAHAIHNKSDRRHNKFIRVNCAAIAESVLESELFGYEEGAFTGAKRGGKTGYFEEANNGSIFLDEIGELSLHMQAKLLRVLQESEVVRVGGTKPVPIDVRVITATNANLEKAIMNGNFREDLYYRLNRLPIYIPPLRERIKDIEAITSYLIEKINQDYGRNVTSIAEDALQYLKQYHWPGNIRELENVIGRAMIYMEVNQETILRKHIPELGLEEAEQKKGQQKEIGVDKGEYAQRPLHKSLEMVEKQIISDVYAQTKFNKTKTAEMLGISIRNLYYKMDKYKIDKKSMQDFA